MGLSNHKVMGLGNYATMGSSYSRAIMIVAAMGSTHELCNNDSYSNWFPHWSHGNDYIVMHSNNNHVAMIVVVMDFHYGGTIGPSSTISCFLIIQAST